MFAGSLYRTQLALVRINSRQRPQPSGHKGFDVVIPSLMLHPSTKKAALLNLSETLSRIQSGERKSSEEDDMKCIVMMQEKKSRFDPISSCLVDFHGRASVASVKNFQVMNQ